MSSTAFDTTIVPGEVLNIEFDFADHADLGSDTLTGTPTVSFPATLVQNADGSTALSRPAGLSASGSASIHGTEVWQKVTTTVDAVAGVTYYAQCSASTTGGQTLKMTARIAVLDPRS